MKRFVEPELVRCGSVTQITRDCLNAKNQGGQDGFQADQPGPWGKVQGDPHDCFSAESRS